MPDWTTFPYHRPGSALSFPRDEGWHRLLPGGLANPSFDEMEWVYLNAHLEEQGGAGRRFVAFAAYFTQGLRFLVVRSFDAEDRALASHTGTAWGLLRPSAERLDLSFRHGGGEDTWQGLEDAGGTPRPFASRLQAVDDAGAFGVDLTLESTKAPYEAGGRGHLPFGRRGAFSYYSLTRLTADGELTFHHPDGATEVVPVRGIGWYDHQWGPFYVTPFRNDLLEEYEWMSVQLDSGDELLLTTVWEADGTTPSLPAYGGAGLIRADGTWDRLVGAERWRRTRFWQDTHNHAVYASGWTFEAPEWGASLVITPRDAEQVTPIVDAPPPGLLGELSDLLGPAANALGAFWEGSCRVHGVFDGHPVTGVAFGELIKRYDAPHVHLELARSEPDLAVVRWRVSNADEQVDLRHRVYVEEASGTVLATFPDLEVPVLALDAPELPRDTPLVVRVVSHSADGALSGTATMTLEIAS